MDSIKARRLAKGWTQEELARRAGVSQPMISLVESGYRPGALSRQRIAKALRTKPGALWPPAVT